jgi:hypothetical protein
MAVSTNAPIVLSVFAFYIFIGVIFGLVGSSLQHTALTSTTIDPPKTPGLLTFLSDIGSFFSGVFFTIGLLPLWANTLLFLPVTFVLVYLVFSFLRGTG